MAGLIGSSSNVRQNSLTFKSDNSEETIDRRSIPPRADLPGRREDAAVIRPLISAAIGIVSASAAVAAQPIEEKASAKVASRDEVWRRRNWLRLACTRNQSWIAVADAAATMMPSAVTAACSGEANSQGIISGAKMTAIAISTTSILARVTRDAGNGAVATRSAASSPEIVSQARPPASWPAAITMTGVISTMRGGAVGKASPQQQRRRHQIKQLHQALRHQPGIAPQQHEFLPAQRLLPRAGAKCLGARRLDGPVAALAGALTTVSAKRGEKIAITTPSRTRPPASRQQQRFAVAERGARRPPDDAVDVRCKRRRGIRSQHREPRQRAIGHDRGDLQRDDEAGADHRGENLRHQPGPARADQAKQQNRDRDRDRRGRQADRDDHAEAESHLMPPPITSTSTKGVDSNSAIA